MIGNPGNPTREFSFCYGCYPSVAPLLPRGSVVGIDEFARLENAGRHCCRKIGTVTAFRRENVLRLVYALVRPLNEFIATRITSCLRTHSGSSERPYDVREVRIRSDDSERTAKVRWLFRSGLETRARARDFSPLRSGPTRQLSPCFSRGDVLAGDPREIRA